MSRYLAQLARETHSRLRPPAGFRLAPRAPAIFDEIYEERMAGPEPARRGAPATAAPLAEPLGTPGPLTPVAETGAIPMPVARPPQPAAEHAGSASPAPLRAPLPVEPAIPATRALPALEALEPPAPRPRAPAPTAGTASPRPASAPPVFDPPAPAAPAPRISEPTLRTLSFFVEPAPAPSQPRLAAPPAPAAPAPVRAHPALPTMPQRPSSTSRQPAVDVTIGSVEVTIESPPQPPLAAMRRHQPLPAAPRPAPPAGGILARQYLDR